MTLPIALVDGEEYLIREVQEMLRPEIEVVHVCIDVDTALTELQPGFAGSHRCPVGSNADLPPDQRRPPRAVLVDARMPVGLELRIGNVAGVPTVRTRPGPPAAGLVADLIRGEVRRLIDEGAIQPE
ncbi:uncharacterized protein B0H64DRAFT_243371 [Chaetomium fimeti]|uniref:Uncharacterized protein n=1 Tax=Chaetomium fimeti TaxID=1854472 RepID=A0AAE0H8L9_9PEZI|nr:hypothetical protein B0H64DRAFT_243371 [Chaetomium fimeti]